MPLIGLKRKASGDSVPSTPLHKKRSYIFRRASATSLKQPSIARPEPALLSISGLKRRGSQILDRLNLRRCETNFSGERFFADVLKTRWQRRTWTEPRLRTTGLRRRRLPLWFLAIESEDSERSSLPLHLTTMTAQVLQKHPPLLSASDP